LDSQGSEESSSPQINTKVPQFTISGSYGVTAADTAHQKPKDAEGESKQDPGLMTGRFTSQVQSTEGLKGVALNPKESIVMMESDAHRTNAGASFTILGSNSTTNIENEMRETSYFQQQEGD
jgi:hypothetical protein